MVLIVGCGFLGSYMIEQLAQKCNTEILATTRNADALSPADGVTYIECDITSEADLTALRKAVSEKSLTVFWLAACHNIDYIYENPHKAYETNITALESFLSSFKNINKFFFASTDCVYGENSPGTEKFTEASALTPVNEYGRQKRLAEELVISKGFTVLRYPFMLGQSLTQKKHFYDKLCHNLISGEKTEMIDGMYRNVLSYRQAAELTLELTEKESLPQIINICSDKTVSKYEMGLILAESLGADENLIVKISEQQGRKFFRDKRASCTDMDNSLLKKLTGREKITWEEEKC